MTERLLRWLNEQYVRETSTQIPNPPGWEIPPKKPGDSDIILTRGYPDGTHEIIRLPKTGTSASST